MIQIALVGGQSKPVIELIRDRKPSRVLLLYTLASKDTLAEIKTLKGPVYDISLVRPDDMLSLQQKVRDYVDLHPSEEIELNVTSGTKLMAIALANFAYELLTEKKVVKVWYVDQGNQVFNLQSGLIEYTIESNLSLLNRLLESNVTFKEPPKSFKEVSQSILELSKEILWFFEKYPELYFKITDEEYRLYDKSFFVGSSEFKVKLDPAESCLFIYDLTKDEQLLFLSTPRLNKLFFKTEWFELLVAEKLSNLPLFNESVIGATGINPETRKAIFEFDVILAYKQRLVFVEAKLSLRDRKDVPKVAMNMKDVGKLDAKGMFVFWSMSKVSDDMLKTCKEHNMMVIAFTDLYNLTPEKFMEKVKLEEFLNKDNIK